MKFEINKESCIYAHTKFPIVALTTLPQMSLTHILNMIVRVALVGNALLLHLLPRHHHSPNLSNLLILYAGF